MMHGIEILFRCKMVGAFNFAVAAANGVVDGVAGEGINVKCKFTGPVARRAPVAAVGAFVGLKGVAVVGGVHVRRFKVFMCEGVNVLRCECVQVRFAVNKW